MRVKMSRRARWAVPTTAVVVTGGIIAGLQMPSALASPSLPAKTPAQLLASVSSDAKTPPLTGTVVETTALGLPQLPSAVSPNSLTALLTGPHTVKVYYQDGKHFRLAFPTTAAETDVIRNGSTLWLWQSGMDSVTKFIVPSDKDQRAAEQKLQAKLPPLTPQQAADQVLKYVGKTTLVSVEANVMIAGEPAYQLVLAPKDHRSLIGKITIAVDGKYAFPLRVQVFAKGAASPAIQVGYTELNFTTPDPANFTFTPPPGATVDTVKPAEHSGTDQSGTKPAHSGFGSYGKNWLTVVEIPQNDLMGALGNAGVPSFGGLRAKHDATAAGVGSSGAPVPAATYAPAGSGGLGISAQDVLGALFGAAKPVHGAWGSGTLLQTSLFSMLMTNGEVYIGAVEPSVLYAAVGHTS
jgi:outer membrane lipoprotein-sorting protein